MAIANGSCVSFCNQPKAQFGYLRRVTPVCRCLHPFCGWRHLTTSRESKAHFGLPWVRPWDNRSKCYMDGKMIQCLSKALQHVPIYLQPFPSNSTRNFKSSPFQHIFAHFFLPWVRPWDNRGKCCMDGKRIQCLSNASQHVPIYLQPFTSYSEMWSEIAIFSYPFHLTPPLWCSHWNSGEKFGPQKTTIMGLPDSEDSLTIG